jgi:uncharacterized membrane protein YhaH (DUF805 family)
MENPYAAPQGRIESPAGIATPLTWKQILFSFQGRIPRRTYWIVALIQIPIGIVYGIIAGLVVGFLRGPEINREQMRLLLIPLYVFSVWVGLAVSVKRCHDRDKSGWFVLIGLIPFIGAIWLLIELGFLRGTLGPNEYGDDPT